MSPLSLWDAPGLNAADTPGMIQGGNKRKPHVYLLVIRMVNFSNRKKKRLSEFNWIQSLFSAFHY